MTTRYPEHAATKIHTLLMAIAEVSFFLDFIQLKTAFSSCGLTGFDLLFGREVVNCGAEHLTIAADLWTELLFLSTGAAIILCISSSVKKGILFLVAIASVVFLILLQLKFQNYFYNRIPIESISFSYGYWLLMLAFAASAIVDYGFKNRKEGMNPQDGSGFNINIITQTGHTGTQEKPITTPNQRIATKNKSTHQ